MKESKIMCYNCNGKIIEYYDKIYHGIRGKCINCKIDFPLE
ncbi:MAG: hypothetical protein O2834_01375 [Crenarchaeota archaeon]|nr:hypothetical protein [Candidatus Nitrosopumilus limneticus]MDA0669464.1 hypothetical protein [Thermoproteota archaeon]HJJ21400.1 hypothetical protein [Nitrosopumilus sp.]MDA1122866.1 hypothetical protein [Thermoproteota archaeon]HJJ24060.1 hypothetical protein [Nitrosopumilus sp.]